MGTQAPGILAAKSLATTNETTPGWGKEYKDMAAEETYEIFLPGIRVHYLQKDVSH